MLDARTTIPRPHVRVLARPRVDALLSGAVRHRVTLVHALAGAGKTTACASWAAAGRYDVAWLTVDPAEGPVRLCAALRTALTRAGPADRLPPAPEDVAQVPGFVTGLAAAVAGAGRGVVLVLDGADELDAAGIAPVGRLVEQAPAELRIVLLGRRRPRLPLARYWVSGDLAVIDSADLACDGEEMTAYAALAGIEADPGELLARTDGWFAAARLCTGGEPLRLTEYVDDEVLRARGPGITGFLTRLSVLDRFTAGLATHLTGHAFAPDLLAALTLDGLVVADPPWLRLRAPLATTLRHPPHAVPPETRGDVIRTAASWHAARGRAHESIRLALTAGGSPRILVDEAFRAVLTAGPSEVEALLDRAETEAADPGTRSPAEARRALGAGPGAAWARPRDESGLLRGRELHRYDAKAARHGDATRRDEAARGNEVTTAPDDEAAALRGHGGTPSGNGEAAPQGDGTAAPRHAGTPEGDGTAARARTPEGDGTPAPRRARTPGGEGMAAARRAGTPEGDGTAVSAGAGASLLGDGIVSAVALVRATARVFAGDAAGARAYLDVAGSGGGGPVMRVKCATLALLLGDEPGDVPGEATSADGEYAYAVGLRRLDGGGFRAAADAFRSAAELLTGFPELAARARAWAALALAVRGDLRDAERRIASCPPGAIPWPLTLARAWVALERDDARTAADALTPLPAPASCATAPAASTQDTAPPAASGATAPAASSLGPEPVTFPGAAFSGAVGSAEPASLPGEPRPDLLAGLVRARLAVVRGELDEAGALLRRLPADGLGGLRTAVEAELALRAGDTARARRLASSDGARRVLLARVLLHDDEPRAALDAVRGALDGRELGAAERVAALGVAAAAHGRLRETGEAARVLGDALALAAGEDAYGPLLACGQPLRAVVTRVRPDDTEHDRVRRELLRRFDLRPVARRDAPVSEEPLTRAELAVLRFLSSHMTNMEIADSLVVSVNTVKTHLRSIYRKLGVTTRRDAIRAADRLGLL